MVEAARKDPRWKSVVSHARSIHGAVAECLKLSDQMSDGELKRETMTFVNAMDYLATSLMKQRRRIGLPRPSETELVNRLREETAHIRQLLEATRQTVQELDDPEAKHVVSSSMDTLKQFMAIVERKQR
jgi:hypothetical protein